MEKIIKTPKEKIMNKLDALEKSVLRNQAKYEKLFKNGKLPDDTWLPGQEGQELLSMVRALKKNVQKFQ